MTRPTGRGPAGGGRPRSGPPASEAPRLPVRERLGAALATDPGRALGLCILAFLVYNANFRPVSAGDCYPARFLPFAIWGRGSLMMDSVLDVARVGFAEPRAVPFWMMRSPSGAYVSSYPLVTPVLVTPLYAPAVAALRLAGWRRDQLAYAGALMEKLSASTVAAATVGLLFLLLRRRLEPRSAVFLTIAFAFGSSTWVTSSQALWQHGATQLLSCVALLALTCEPRATQLAIAGIACGLIPFNRPPDLPIAVALGAVALLTARRRSWPFIVSAVAAAIPFAILNVVMHGHVGGGYFRGVTVESFYTGSFTVGLAGLLVSPAKGLLFFSPFLVLLLVLRLRRLEPGDGYGRLDVALLLAVIGTLVLLAKGDFRAGYCYGPRFLTGILPALFWVLAPAMRDLSRATRGLFVAGVAAGAVMQAVGAFCYPHGLSDLKSAWSIREAPFIVEARAGIACPELLEPLVKCKRR